MIQEIHWHGENDGRVVLGSDTAQSLEVPKLKSCKVDINMSTRAGSSATGATSGGLIEKRGQRFMSPLPLTKKAEAAPLWFTCKAEELSAITLAASRKALEAFCSPSAAITYRKKNVVKQKIFKYFTM